MLSWRVAREERLRSETGWLSVAGLFWLEPGENTFGTGRENAIVLPEGSAPQRAGSFLLSPNPEDGKPKDESDKPARAEVERGAGAAGIVVVRAEPGVEMHLADSLKTPVTERRLFTDEDGAPDVLRLGRLQITVIKRGERYAVRLRDPESPMRKAFEGIHYFPLQPDYRVTARFTPFRGAAHTIEVPNIAGYVDSMIVPGIVSFVLDGNHLQLKPVLEDPADSSFFFIFADSTTEVETYGGGRFLYADLQPDNTLTLDFNKAYNPPCAFTPYTTCPLPPPGNRLPIYVRAGEMKYEGADAH
jgi:uncharacterized protein (DUF1684 family)